jgi:transcriptional regulator with GAF, ATPase, and Fis domain
MAVVKIKRILRQNNSEPARLLQSINSRMGTAFCIRDPEGEVLLGQEAPGENSIPIQYDGMTLGWASASGDSRLFADILQCLARMEHEKHLLAEEALNRYREVNLMYTLAEKLNRTLDLQTVASTAVDEAHRLIHFSNGAVLLLNQKTGRLEWLAGIGTPHPPISPSEGIQGRVFETAKAELINEVCSEEIHSEAESQFCAMLVAPLMSKGRTMGLLVAARESPKPFVAGDLKLLNTLATQASPAVENALLYETTLREARLREEQLEQQIQALRIELDETRQAYKTSEITDTDYFRDLQQQAELIRGIINGAAD